MQADQLPIPHPGETLLHDFMEPAGLSERDVAQAIGVFTITIQLLCRGKSTVTADTAFRLARYFGTTPRFWLNLQLDYDLRTHERSMVEELAKITPR